MLRSTKHILKYQTGTKSKQLDQLFQDYKVDLQFYVDQIWDKKLPLKKFLSTKDCPSNILTHSTWKSALYKQASGIIRSNKEKNKKSKPEIKSVSISLNEYLFDIEFQSSGHFDEFIRIRLPYFQDGKHRAVTINLPIKYHKHYLKYADWKRKKNIKLVKDSDGKYFVFLTFEKEAPVIKTVGKSLGIDIGYKKLLSTSDGQFLGTDIEKVCTDISKKVRNSKNFKQNLRFRDNEINRVVNELDLSNVNSLVIEDLKNVKRNTKKDHRVLTKFMNKLQYWVYLAAIGKLVRACEENGVLLTKVNPAYTSQTCSVCGSIHKESRVGERYKCIDCKVEMDADYNAAINILHRVAKEPCQKSLSTINCGG